MWVATADLPRSAGHPFYERLNQVLDDARFDAVVEAQCAPFYADGMGRPSLAPNRYFRLLLLGYFEGVATAQPPAPRGGACRGPDRPSQRVLGRCTACVGLAAPRCAEFGEWRPRDTSTRTLDP